MIAEAFDPKKVVTEYDPAKGIVAGTYVGHGAYPPFDHEEEFLKPVVKGLEALVGAAAEGVKHDQGKPDYTLLPLKTLEGVVRVMEFGVKKYARDDWKRLPDGYNRYLAAHLRHMVEVLENPNHVDDESGLLSYDHALCDLIFARRFLK